MTSHYDDAKEAIGPGPKMPCKGEFTVYFGYAKGTTIGSFSSKDEAMAAGATTTERSFDQEGYDAAVKAYRDHNTLIMDEWIARMRAEHSDLNDEVFNITYGMAYENGHSSGLHEVELYVDDFAEFAKKVIAASQKEVKA